MSPGQSQRQLLKLRTEVTCGQDGGDISECCPTEHLHLADSCHIQAFPGKSRVHVLGIRLLVLGIN